MSFQQVAEVWSAADEMPELEGGYVWDHFYGWDGDSSAACLEGWVALTALLSATTRIRGSIMVTAVPYRHPALVANMAAALDVVSGGRFELGLGAGWLAEEARAYGIELGRRKERADRLDEASEVIVSLLTMERVDFDGRFFHLQDARCEPKCVQLPHVPICIGGGGEQRTIPTAARWAQHWNVASVVAAPEAFASKRELFLRSAQAFGRDPSALTSSVNLPFDREDRDAFRSQAQAYVAAGADALGVLLPEPATPDDLVDLVDSVGDLVS